MSTPSVEISTPEGAQWSVDLTSERILVGSSPACQIVLDRPEFAREHVLLSPRPDGCYVALARGAPTPVMFNGVPIERSVVPWGAELTIGGVRFALKNQDAPSGEGTGEKKDEKPSPVLLLAALVGVAVLGYVMLGGDGGTGVAKPRGEPPAMFDPLERTCQAGDAERAGVMAAEFSRRATAKAERMPFRAQDGIEAVGLFANAAACFRTATQADRATRAMEQAGQLKDSLERELRNHRFRLERAIEQERPSDGVVEVRLMMNLLQHRPGEYLSSLNNLERRLALQVDRAQAQR
ncbi:MAG: FHA domain-containing protein [Deltaproteobacteria bacterium]|nr:FHA domain-containing protein [Deltaproteobacteria bacterium]